MPLSTRDRRFLEAVGRLKVSLLVLAVAVLSYLILSPSEELHTGTAIIGLALCGVFWLTQRLLAFITVLDFELTRLINLVKRLVPEEEREELSQETARPPQNPKSGNLTSSRQTRTPAG